MRQPLSSGSACLALPSPVQQILNHAAHPSRRPRLPSVKQPNQAILLGLAQNFSLTHACHIDSLHLSVVHLSPPHELTSCN